jgi:hypothetical protein
LYAKRAKDVNDLSYLLVEGKVLPFLGLPAGAKMQNGRPCNIICERQKREKQRLSGYPIIQQVYEE